MYSFDFLSSSSHNPRKPFSEEELEELIHELFPQDSAYPADLNKSILLVTPISLANGRSSGKIMTKMKSMNTFNTITLDEVV